MSSHPEAVSSSRAANSVFGFLFVASEMLSQRFCHRDFVSELSLSPRGVVKGLGIAQNSRVSNNFIFKLTTLKPKLLYFSAIVKSIIIIVVILVALKKALHRLFLYGFLPMTSGAFFIYYSITMDAQFQ